MSSIVDLERIKVNDTRLKDVKLDYGGRGMGPPPIDYIGPVFEALRDNTVVKTLSLTLDNDKRKLDRASRLAFADMLSKSNTIQKVTLRLVSRSDCPCRELELLMNVLTDHGEGICLEYFNIQDYGHSSNDFMCGVVEYLTRWPQAVRKLQFAATSSSRKSPLAEQVLKGIASTQIDSLFLEGRDWYNKHDVAAAMEQPCFRLKELSMTCNRAPCRRFLDALNANTSITSLHLLIKTHRFIRVFPRPPTLVRVLPSLENIQKLSLKGLYRADLDSVCFAVRRHGNIQSLRLEWYSRNQEERVRDVTTTFVPAVFQGLEEIDFRMLCGRNVTMDYYLQTAGSTFTAICSSLRNNQTIRKLALSFSDLPVNVFPSLTDGAITTMPNLHVLSVGFRSLQEEPADMLLAVIKRYKNIHKVTCTRGPSKTIRAEIDRHCERNRIDYPKLLAADAESIPLALWPNIMAKVGQVDVRLELLREKNDVMLMNLPR